MLFVGQGSNTGYWYLEALAVLLAKMDAPELIVLKPVKRTGNERNQSAPEKLLEQAKRIRDDADKSLGFDPKEDSIVIFFDADIYKGKAERYASILKEFSGVAEVAVTNPSFELYLLLHFDGALKKYIEPHKKNILDNNYDGKRRYVDKLASSALGFNVKKNKRVGELVQRFGVAVTNERELNQDTKQAIGQLTSNVGMRIMEVIRAGAYSEENYFRLCKRLGIDDAC